MAQSETACPSSMRLSAMPIKLRPGFYLLGPQRLAMPAKPRPSNAIDPGSGADAGTAYGSSGWRFQEVYRHGTQWTYRNRSLGPPQELPTGNIERIISMRLKEWVGAPHMPFCGLIERAGDNGRVLDVASAEFRVLGVRGLRAAELSVCPHAYAWRFSGLRKWALGHALWDGAKNGDRELYFFGDGFGLEKLEQVIGAAGFGVGSGHIKSSEGVRPDHGSGAFPV